MAKRGESIAAANKAAREKSEAVDFAGLEAWLDEISALRELQAGVSAALLPVTRESENGALLQNVVARVVADLVNAEQRRDQLRYELGGELRGLQVAVGDIPVLGGPLESVPRARAAGDRIRQLEADLEMAQRELGALHKRNHDLTNDFIVAQARPSMLLQDRDAPPRGTCEYPGCKGPVPPGETIFGAVHPALGRRA
jgi:hypothetical protein